MAISSFSSCSSCRFWYYKCISSRSAYFSYMIFLAETATSYTWSILSPSYSCFYSSILNALSLSFMSMSLASTLNSYNSACFWTFTSSILRSDSHFLTSPSNLGIELDRCWILSFYWRKSDSSLKAFETVSFTSVISPISLAWVSK